MADQDQLAVLRQGVSGWNEWRDANPGTRPNLSEADFTRVYLSESDLTSAHLSSVNLASADLRN